MMKDMKARRPEPFAPPYLVTDDGLVIAQVANILLYLGDTHGLAPKEPAGRHLAHEVQLTVADMVVEAHNVHHPVGVSDYYHDQKPEAARAAKGFREERIPNSSAGSSGRWIMPTATG
jgi:glutathione S-transferase